MLPNPIEDEFDDALPERLLVDDVEATTIRVIWAP